MPLQHLCQENSMNRNKRLKDMMLEDEPLRSKSIQHATEEELVITGDWNAKPGSQEIK